MKRKSEIGFGLKAAVLFLLCASFFTCRIGVKESGDGGNKTGVGTPTPANGTQNVSVNPTLSWDFPAVDGKIGIQYDVLLSTNNPPQTVLVRDLSSTSYTASGLTPGATYYWRVDYLDGSTVVNGPVWSFTVTTDVNDPPVFAGLRDTTINEGQQLRLTLSAPDPDGDNVTYSMTGGPQGATLTGNAFAWTPNFSQTGVHQIRFIAQDDGSPRLSDTADIRVTVSNVSAPPVLQQPRDTTVNEGQTLRITLSASDPDGDALVYSMSNSAPSGTALAGNVFTWTPDTNQAGTYLIDFTVTEQTADSLRDTKTARITVRDVGTTAGLVAYWDFNEGTGTTLTDRSGNGNHGTIFGTTWTNGIEGGALSFDGVDDYVNCGNGSSLQLSNAYTMSAWVKGATRPTGDAIEHIITKTSSYVLGWDHDDPSYNTSTHIRSGNAWFNSGRVADPIANQWHHLVGVFNDSILSLYIDGALNSSNNIGSRMMNNSADSLKISTPGSSRFVGLIDEIRIYNRALTAAEITVEWDKYKDKIPPTNGLLAYWPFSGNANDASGNGNNGTVNGATLAADRFENANGAYSFDGVDDYISLPAIIPTASTTVSVWFKRNNSNDGRLFSWGPQTGCNPSRQHFGVSADRLMFRVGCSTTDLISFDSLLVGTWYHSAVIINSTGATTVYLNGVMQANGNPRDGQTVSGGSNLIGANYSSSVMNSFFNGYIDDFRIYNRTLSASEIQVLYNEGR